MNTIALTEVTRPASTHSRVRSVVIRSRPYLDGAKLQQIVLDHTAARGNYTLELHRFLTLELAQRTLIEAAQQAIDKAA
jgi:hypothetical protein